jgi:1-acyl-sn-glycerol-3-phosphate acyltransferase
MNLLTSALRWLLCGAWMLVWYPILVGGSYVMPISRLAGLARFFFRSTLRILGAKLVVKGLEHIDPSKPYLYMGNHVSLFDPFAFVAAVPQYVVAVEKRPNFKIPVYGRLIGRWGNIPIDRESPSAALRTLIECGQKLKEGQSICLMPEGTRTRTGEMGEFKNGPFRVAMDAGAQVVPFALKGMLDFNKTGTWRVHRATVEVIFTPPVDGTAYDKKTLQAFSDRVRDQLVEALDRLPDNAVI